jgi:hypothetical protein
MLTVAGAIALAGYLLAPVQATADLNKCGKEVAKNGFKMAIEAQKNLQACVDAQLAEEDKAAANVAKGKTVTDKAFAGLHKAGLKCQKSIAKLYGDTGDKITLVADIEDNPKGKLGAGYDKIAGPVNGLVAKGKCGDPDTVALEEFDELNDLGLGRDFNIAARIIASGAVGEGWADQLKRNIASGGAMDDMVADRCVKTGVTCFVNADCPLNPAHVPLHPKNTVDDICTTPCPDCDRFGRAIVTSAPTTAGTFTGPCGRQTCTLDGGTLIQNISPPAVTIPVGFTGLIGLEVCDQHIALPDAYSVHGIPDRTNKASLGPLTVCVDTISANGYIKKNALAFPPSVSTAACADGNLNVDSAGGAADPNDCLGFVACGDPSPRELPDGTALPGPETITCLDSTAAASSAGDAVVRLALRLSITSPAQVGGDGASCTTDDTAPAGGVTVIGLGTVGATASLYGGGAGGTFGGATGTASSPPGTPFDVSPTGIPRGRLAAADLVGAFSAIDANGNGLLGDSITVFTLSCTP